MNNGMNARKARTEGNKREQTPTGAGAYMPNLETLHISNSKDKANPGFRPFGFIINGRDMNLTNMILNIESNNSNNYLKPNEVYQVYSKMEEIDASPEFRKSLENSSWAVKVPPVLDSELSKLKVNDPKSFLVLPMLGKGHLWSTLIRKTDEGFSATVVNKGLRFWHDPMEEFVFKKENQKKLVSALNYTGFSTAHSVEDVYRKFIANSDKQYNLKINAAPQKVGNCFTKNIQAGIKLAYATQNISPQEMRSFRINREYTPFGTPNTGKKTFKWNMSTETMQKLFVRKLVENNPGIAQSASQSLEIYTANKHFRQEMKRSPNIMGSFIKSFDPENKSGQLDRGNRIQYLLKDLTPYTYSSNRKNIDAIVRDSGNSQLKTQYDTLNKLSEYSKREMGNLYFHFYMDANHDVSKSLEAVFNKNGVFDKMPPQQKAKAYLDKLNPEIIYLHKNKLIPLIEAVYGKENPKDAYQKMLERSVENMKNHEKTKPSPEMQKQISKTFPIISGQVNHRISNYYNNIAEALLLQEDKPKDALRFLDKSAQIQPSFDTSHTRGQCLDRLGDHKGAVAEFSQAIRLSPENAIAYVNRGRAFEHMNNKMAAKADFAQAIKIDPGLREQLQIQGNMATMDRVMER